MKCSASLRHHRLFSNFSHSCCANFFAIFFAFAASPLFFFVFFLRYVAARYLSDFLHIYFYFISFSVFLHYFCIFFLRIAPLFFFLFHSLFPCFFHNVALLFLCFVSRFESRQLAQIELRRCRRCRCRRCRCCRCRCRRSCATMMLFCFRE